MLFFRWKNYLIPWNENLISDNVADPNPYVFLPPGSGSRFISQRFGSGSYWFVISLLILSWKNDVNIPSKNKKQKNLEKKFFIGVQSMTKVAGSGSVPKCHGSATLCSGFWSRDLSCPMWSEKWIWMRLRKGVPCSVRYQIIYILSHSDWAGEGRRDRGGGQPLGRIEQRPQSSEQQVRIQNNRSLNLVTVRL